MSLNPILYIEDEEDYQILVKRILGHAGLEIVIADTGKQGLALLQECRPGMLILDINLPDTDGYSICHQLRQDPAWEDLPILLLTVRRRPEEWLRGFSSGANDYISKPLNPPELIERVVNCLEGKSQRFKSGATAEYQLIQAASSGNRAAFDILIQQYKPRLIESMRQTSRDETEAEDVVSYAFIKAFERLHTFRGEASFYTWLYRIALNEAMARGKKETLSIEELTRGDETFLPAALTERDSVHQELADQDSVAHVHEALSRVPEPYRRMLELFFLNNLSYDQIAQRLRVPEGTVMSRLYKARRLLKEAWEQKQAPVGVSGAA
ncbi:MAG: sigma-70 family RNA polymerase sigma factor [Elusimicrobiota bacterium]|jgi:RNA polymerase sigma-70 factor (ECF subfamily)